MSAAACPDIPPMTTGKVLKLTFGNLFLTTCLIVCVAYGPSKNVFSTEVFSKRATFNRFKSTSGFRQTSTIAMSKESLFEPSRNIERFPLSGKTALITGSSGGIGAAIAKKFADAGADVIIHYNTRREEAISICREINKRYSIAAEKDLKKIDESILNDGITKEISKNDRRHPGKCLGVIKADFRDPSAAEQMFRLVANDILKESRLDILVNNAGVVTKLAIEDDDNLSAWHETMAINLHAPLQLMKLAYEHMKLQSLERGKNSERKGGVIINNSSVHGTRPVEFMTAYGASKAALDSLTRSLSSEYAPDGIRVNAIAPGVVPVERTAKVFANPEARELWEKHLPVGRMGHVEDIADATLTLATNEWMTGTILTVDGGMTARANMPVRPRPKKPEKNGMETQNGVNEETAQYPPVLFEMPS